ncbi:armadillo-type protein, partial [Baffinella frigidus]
MRDHPEDPGVQENGCWALGSLGGTPPLSFAPLASQLGPRAVARAMETTCSSHPGVQAMGCGAIWSLAEVPNSRIASEGGVRLAARAMREHPGHFNVQLQGSGAFRALSKDVRNKDSIRTIGAVDLILKALRRHPESEALAEQGIPALWLLSHGAQGEDLRPWSDEHAIAERTVVLAMRRHGDNATIQEAACGLLGTLSLMEHSPEKLRSLCGGAAVLGAMFRHMFDRGVQAEALGALASFALAPRLAQTLTPGGADAVVRSLERLKQDPGVVANGCRAIAGIAGRRGTSLIWRDPDEDGRQDLSRSGEVEPGKVAIQAVIDGMQEQRGEARAQENGCIALRRLLSSEPTNKGAFKVAGCGAIPCILRAMQAHLSAAGVQEQGCAALWDLIAGHAPNKQRILERGGAALVVRAIERHPQHIGVRDNSAGALRFLEVAYKAPVFSLAGARMALIGATRPLGPVVHQDLGALLEERGRGVKGYAGGESSVMSEVG